MTNVAANTATPVEDTLGMVVVADPIVHEGEHAPFNAGLLQVVAELAPRKVRFLAEAQHVEAVTELLPQSVSAAVDVRVIQPPSRRLPRVGRVWPDLCLAFRMTRDAAAAGADILIFASAPPGTLIGMKLGLWTIPPSRRPTTCAVQHGELANIWGWRSRNPLRRAVDVAGALSMPAPRQFRLVVLETGIGEALAAVRPKLRSRIVVLEHPVAEKLEPAPGRRAGPVRVGFLGLTTRGKGFEAFCDLARLMAARGGEAEFHVVGRGDAWGQEVARGVPLATPPATGRIDRSEYVRRLVDMDIVVLLHNDRHYRYTPSGVLLDALAAERPVLSLPSILIDALRERYGPIGPRCEDIGAAAALLERLTPADLDGPAFSDYRANLRRAAQARRPAVLASALRRALATSTADLAR